MKVIGFSQLHNEEEKGNLLNWLKCMDMCEYIYIYDQASTDNSKEIYKQNEKCVVIESPTNNFVNENLCKDELLKKLLAEHPDVDWILWADGDYLLDGRYLKDNYNLFFEMLKTADAKNLDGLAFGHYNLWRSDTFYRVDQMYHASHDGGRVSLWKNNGKLKMNTEPGLHKSPLPSGLEKIERVDCNLIHRGFATDSQIMTKYNIYKSFGQRGWELSRLIDESTLTVVELPENLLPDWFNVTDTTHPTLKPKLKSLLG